MKLFLVGLLALGSTFLSAQSYTHIATDATGDDYTGNPDAQNLYSALSQGGDTLLLKMEHFNMRQGSFGYALALDTNQNVSDGYMNPQNNLKSGNPNTSMGSDISFYLYQNGVFPTIYSETYNGNGNSIGGQQFDFEFPSNNEVIFKIPLSRVGGDTNLRVLAFTGTFDIAPGGAGPSDVMPNTGFATVGTLHNVALTELSLQLDIFPNPATDQVHLQGAQSYFELLSIEGRTMAKWAVNHRAVYNISEIPPGLYLIRADGEKALHKLLIN